ncbi:cobalt transporter [Solibacillus sp. R5-41]|uniref:copper resistance CopC family protein n=1 Tax=Solibacillus sp. R5-41 TaxID=2048654 RepID=UPI000C124858|nr:copper resistance protein CopC [Solibacillus sp. R5-41]ATP40555.1 cobalt transporter [Solibacillus sp. R5-41]
MKKIILSAFALFLLFSPQAFAHTYLDSTTPADGEVLTTDIQSIELNYSGKIEEGSFFTLESSAGNEIPVSSFTVDSGVLKGQLDAPLKNDTYTVKWNSISQDGHPLSGNFSFTVNKAEAEQTDEVKTEEKTDVVDIEQQAKQPIVGEEETDDSKSSSSLIVAGVILVVLIAISTFVLWKRKK